MKAVDRNLLLRVARRVEERAKADYNAATEDPSVRTGGLELPKRQRDREVGDATDIKDYVKRATDDAADAGRMRFLLANVDVLDQVRGLMESRSAEDVCRYIDSSIAAAAQPKPAE